jgi:hypothetical protein
MKLHVSRHYVFFAERRLGMKQPAMELIASLPYLRILCLMKLAFYLAAINLPDL